MNASNSTTTDIRARTARGLLLAAELERARVAKGLTTRQLATRMSMSASMVNRVMNGRRTPTAMEIGGLCAVLETPPWRRPHLYALAREADLREWTIHGTAHDHDPHGVVRALWTLATSADTYAPTTAPPRVHATGRTWTHYVPASALTGPVDVQATPVEAIRVIPETTPPPFRHPVQVLHLPHYSPVVLVDLDRTSLVLEGDNATHYAETLARAAAKALPASESRSAVERALDMTDTAGCTGTD
ncbi:helix-turn-helix domain-containing protein [Actinokineospora pegani]|uniref:helix-turn-helix domain-containing protein n=1 Tax=Actinokineospora pegani TaxID=2654637 RepID=UPI0018D3D858|nr:helix-turn-helix transcriptional regulator [Actinokineospora pegani]